MTIAAQPVSASTTGQPRARPHAGLTTPVQVVANASDAHPPRALSNGCEDRISAGEYPDRAGGEHLNRHDGASGGDYTSAGMPNFEP